LRIFAFLFYSICTGYACSFHLCLMAGCFCSFRVGGSDAHKVRHLSRTLGKVKASTYHGMLSNCYDEQVFARMNMEALLAM